MERLQRLQAYLRQAFWFIPAACVVGAIVLAMALLQVDRRLEKVGDVFAFTGGPDSARSLLTAISSSMLTLTALVFSITIVVLQLTSSQFSPRVLRTFLQDRQNQISLGVFIATFVYALMVLREVRGQDVAVDLFVPGVTITVAFGLVLLSIAVFVAYIHHIANSIRVITIVTRIREETEEAIERSIPADEAPVHVPSALPHGDCVVVSKRSGVVVDLDLPRLVATAAAADTLVRVVPRVGDYVPLGAPLLQVARDGLDEAELRETVRLDAERDAHQDVAFGLRQLVDIAERALSPGINDPTTAVQCIDQMHTLLRILATRPMPTGAHADDDGIVRLLVPTTSWDDFVGLACDEVRHWGASSLQVHRRLRGMLGDLLDVVDDDRRRPLERQLALLAERTVELPEAERDGASRPSRRGASDQRGG